MKRKCGVAKRIEMYLFGIAICTAIVMLCNPKLRDVQQLFTVMIMLQSVTGTNYVMKLVLHTTKIQYSSRNMGENVSCTNILFTLLSKVGICKGICHCLTVHVILLNQWGLCRACGTKLQLFEKPYLAKIA